MLSDGSWLRGLGLGRLGLGLVLIFAACGQPPLYQRYEDHIQHGVATGGANGSGGVPPTGSTGAGGREGIGSLGGAAAGPAGMGGPGAATTGSAGSAATGGNTGPGGATATGGTSGTGGAKVPGALAHYSFDESSGIIAHDDAGLSPQDGALNGATFAAGHVGNAVALSGDNQYVFFPPGLTFGLSDMTVTFWMKMASKNPFQRVISVGNSLPNGYWYVAPSFGPGGVLRFGITTRDWGTEQFVEGPPLVANEWKHVAIVLSAQGATLYLDGTAVASTRSITLRPKDLGALPNAWLGRSPYANEPYFKGAIDDFAVFGRALSASEIATLMGGL